VVPISLLHQYPFLVNEWSQVELQIVIILIAASLVKQDSYNVRSRWKTSTRIDFDFRGAYRRETYEARVYKNRRNI